MDDILLLQIHAPPEPAVVSTVRHSVVSALPDVCDDQSSEAETIVAELVANAVEHAETALEVRVLRRGGSLRIEVDDDGRGWPVLRDPEPLAERGRGLFIVDHLSERWGIDRHARDGKTIWAEMSCSRDPVDGGSTAGRGSGRLGSFVTG